MLSNYHTHTTYCDGKNTPREIVLAAIERGFSAIGFSGHGYTPFDTRYCLRDTEGYIAEISRLKNEFCDKIQVYCGVEEDAFSYVRREKFDYIIGSSHYLKVGEEYLPIDSSHEHFKKCLEAFGGEPLALADAYYGAFVSYIKERKPDIVGHFDLITKYDELSESIFINNSEYLKLAEKYIEEAAEVDVIFEINTGAIARGVRKSPYLGEELLYVLKKKDSRLILSSDSHNAETLGFYFEEIKKLLRYVGFRAVYELDCGKFVKKHI